MSMSMFHIQLVTIDTKGTLTEYPLSKVLPVSKSLENSAKLRSEGKYTEVQSSAWIGATYNNRPIVNLFVCEILGLYTKELCLTAYILHTRIE